MREKESKKMVPMIERERERERGELYEREMS